VANTPCAMLPPDITIAAGRVTAVCMLQEVALLVKILALVEGASVLIGSRSVLGTAFLKFYLLFSALPIHCYFTCC